VRFVSYNVYMEETKNIKPTQAEINAEVSKMGLDVMYPKKVGNIKQRPILILWSFFALLVALEFLIAKYYLALHLPLELVSLFILPLGFLIYALVPILILLTVVILILRIINRSKENKVKN
jgi:hypothetical protein